MPQSLAAMPRKPTAASSSNETYCGAADKMDRVSGRSWFRQVLRPIRISIATAGNSQRLHLTCSGNDDHYA